MRRLLLIAGLVLGGAAGALGISSVADSPEASDERPRVVAAASYRWPTETLRDWVDFADQVSVLRVTSERKLPRTEDLVQNGEGYLGRSVTAVIEATVWRNPGSPRVEDEVTMKDWGWAVGDGTLTPMVDSSSIRVEVGDRVLAALLLAPEGEWTAINPGTVIRLRGGRTDLEPQQKTAYPGLVAALDRQTPAQIAARLKATVPSGNRAHLRSLDPDARRIYLQDR